VKNYLFVPGKEQDDDQISEESDESDGEKCERSGQVAAGRHQGSILEARGVHGGTSVA
jgi:hypothetical protein